MIYFVYSTISNRKSSVGHGQKNIDCYQVKVLAWDSRLPCRVYTSSSPFSAFQVFLNKVITKQIQGMSFSGTWKTFASKDVTRISELFRPTPLVGQSVFLRTSYHARNRNVLWKSRSCNIVIIHELIIFCYFEKKKLLSTFKCVRRLRVKMKKQIFWNSACFWTFFPPQLRCHVRRCGSWIKYVFGKFTRSNYQW